VNPQVRKRRRNPVVFHEDSEVNPQADPTPPERLRIPEQGPYREIPPREEVHEMRCVSRECHAYNGSGSGFSRSSCTGEDSRQLERTRPSPSRRHMSGGFVRPRTHFRSHTFSPAGLSRAGAGLCRLVPTTTRMCFGSASLESPACVRAAARAITSAHDPKGSLCVPHAEKLPWQAMVIRATPLAL
jgi:hypothetical protein